MNMAGIETHKLIIDRCESLLNVLYEDKDVVMSIMSKSKKIVDDYNKNNSTIVDISSDERGYWLQSSKVIIFGRYSLRINKKFKQELKDNIGYYQYCDSHKYYNIDFDQMLFDEDKFCDKCKAHKKKKDLLTKEYNEKIKKVKIEFKEAYDRTVFPSELVMRSVSMKRISSKKKILNSLDVESKDNIKKDIIKAFSEQNKKLIFGYN